MSVSDGARSDHRWHRLMVLLDGVGFDSRSGEASGSGTARPRELPGLRARLGRICVVTASEVGVDGAGVTVMGSADAGRAGHRDQLAATGALTRRLEDLQLTAGEGPCLDAYGTGMPVLAGDLPSETARWLGYGPEALTAGAAAVFSLPLQVGAVRLGTLDLNRASTGSLSRTQLADALALAGLVTESLLELAEHPDPSQNDPGADPHSRQAAGWLPDVHADVHVASGMISVQLGIDVGTALLRLRAHAFASSEPISEVARRIINRTVVFDDQGGRDSNSYGLSGAEPEERERVRQHRPPVQWPGQDRGGAVIAGHLPGHRVGARTTIHEQRPRAPRRPDSWSGLEQARAAATANGDRRVGTQHLLLALLMRPDGTAGEALAQAGVALMQVQTVLAALHGPRPLPTPTKPPAVELAPRAVALLAMAAQTRAEVPGDGQIRDDDVLDALLASDDLATANTILRYLGVNAHRAARIRRRLSR